MAAAQPGKTDNQRAQLLFLAAMLNKGQVSEALLKAREAGIDLDEAAPSLHIILFITKFILEVAQDRTTYSSSCVSLSKIIVTNS